MVLLTVFGLTSNRQRARYGQVSFMVEEREYAGLFERMACSCSLSETNGRFGNAWKLGFSPLVHGNYVGI